MRLSILEKGKGLRPLQKLQLFMIRLLTKGFIPGPVLVMSYRRELFGKAFSVTLHEALRQMTEWELGEVELFAAFVSKQHECFY